MFKKLTGEELKARAVLNMDITPLLCIQNEVIMRVDEFWIDFIRGLMSSRHGWDKHGDVEAMEMAIKLRNINADSDLYSEVFTDERPTTKDEVCSSCQGTGRIFHKFRSSMHSDFCIICHGKGKVVKVEATLKDSVLASVSVPADTLKEGAVITLKSPGCNVLGEVPSRTRCTDCNGSGVIFEAGRPASYNEPCEPCQGKGWIV